MKLNTDTHGFNLRMNGHLTKNHIVEMCKDLGEEFGPGNSFRPEGICDGFLIWTEWPGKDKDGYKCMRLFRDHHADYLEEQKALRTKPFRYTRVEYKWPWIDEDVMETWKENHDVVIPIGKYRTFLKAFETAPRWTREELDVVRQVMHGYGIEVGCSPSQRKLDSSAYPGTKKRKIV